MISIIAGIVVMVLISIVAERTGGMKNPSPIVRYGLLVGYVFGIAILVRGLI